MSDRFLSFDLDGFLSSIEKTKLGLDIGAQIVEEAALQAIYAIAKDIVAQAQISLEEQTRSGDLSRSAVVLDPEVIDRAIVVTFGFTARYAAQRDQGGTILPKNGSMLAIPLEPILTATGSRFKSPREENNLVVVPILGNVYLVDKTTHEFHWLLVPSVTQEGSHYLTGVVQERQAQIGAIVAQLVKEDLDGRAAA